MYQSLMKMECSYTAKGSAKGQFLQQRGVTVSPNNDVFVVDFDNKRVQIF